MTVRAFRLIIPGIHIFSLKINSIGIHKFMVKVAGKNPFWKRRKFWKRLLVFSIITPVVLLAIIITMLYIKQDAVVQHLLKELNSDFRGHIRIRDSHVSLFENLPYISIDLEDVVVYENKSDTGTALVDVKDVFIGFDLFSVISGKMNIRSIKLKDGAIHLVQHKDGEFNIAKALSPEKPGVNAEEALHLKINTISLENIDLNKFNESTNMLVDTYIAEAVSSFSTSSGHLQIGLQSKFELNLVIDNDTTFIKHKHFEVSTELDFNKTTELLTIHPTVARLEGAEFNIGGTVDVKQDMLLDLRFDGKKPNFALFIAMAPEELIPFFQKYENKGQVYFEVTVNGRSANGYKPAVNARFGCKDAYFNNFTVNRKLNDLNFAGYFTNGAARDLETMEFGVSDFTARPEAGTFSGSLVVKNFKVPDINLQLKSEFELDFLAKFLNISDLSELSGKIALTMNFKDIIDLEHPENSLRKLNESYFTQLKVDNLGFRHSAYHLPMKNVNLYMEVNGHEADIRYFNFRAGKSDLSMKGLISDLPAILHHTDIPVHTQLDVESRLLDLFELTGADTTRSVNEQLENLSMQLRFESSARAFTESAHLPEGEFFVDNLFVKMKHYPHTLHDFHADVYVDDQNFRVVDFKGEIDKSDFFFSGILRHYEFLFAENPAGKTQIEFNLVSDTLQLADIFSYKGANYVPEDYRHEEFSKLRVHGVSDVTFDHGLKGIDLKLDRFDAGMKVHPMRFENFNGRLHYEKDHLVVENFSGKIGNSDFRTTMHYYFGTDESGRKRRNYVELHANYLDFDELFSFNLSKTAGRSGEAHDSVFNIYTVPFSDMNVNLDIGHLRYHRYMIDQLHARLRTAKNHYLYIDDMKMAAAGGTFAIKGYFNGSDPNKIYFSPQMEMAHVDLDKLMLKFDNFGQDHLVSENLHGAFSGKLTGKVHMHTDLVPKLDDSEVHIDVQVINGKLENYSVLTCMADFFKDKNMSKVAFDTLSNHIDMTNGVLTIPNMAVNSSIGFFEISGKQDMQLNMEYYLRIPWKMVTETASSKLFGRKTTEVDPEQVDAIQYADPEKKTRYLNLKLTGNATGYKITPGKAKPAR